MNKSISKQNYTTNPKTFTKQTELFIIYRDVKTMK